MLFDPTVEFTDDNDYLTCMAGRKTNKNNAANGLIGMVNSLTVYSDRYTVTDLEAMVTTT